MERELQGEGYCKTFYTLANVANQIKSILSEVNTAHPPPLITVNSSCSVPSEIDISH